MTKPARFTQADVTRAVAAMRKAGCIVAGAKIEADGSITVFTGSASGMPANDRNPLDRLLNG